MLNPAAMEMMSWCFSKHFIELSDVLRVLHTMLVFSHNKPLAREVSSIFTWFSSCPLPQNAGQYLYIIYSCVASGYIIDVFYIS
jgi:hypothetical protein